MNTFIYGLVSYRDMNNQEKWKFVAVNCAKCGWGTYPHEGRLVGAEVVCNECLGLDGTWFTEHVEVEQ